MTIPLTLEETRFRSVKTFLERRTTTLTHITWLLITGESTPLVIAIHPPALLQLVRWPYLLTWVEL